MANNNPIFILTPRITSTVCSASSTRDGSGGTLYSLFIPDTTNGSRVEKITCMLAGTNSSASSAMAVRLYITDIGGNNPRLFRETLIASATPTATALGGNTTFTFPGGLGIGTASEIRVGQSTYGGVNDTTHWTCEGGNF